MVILGLQARKRALMVDYNFHFVDPSSCGSAQAIEPSLFTASAPEFSRLTMKLRYEIFQHIDVEVISLEEMMRM
jgi:hypothetical protein